MIATLTLNPCLDKTVTVKGLVVDDVNRWLTLRRDPGGKGIDVSRAIRELGGDAVAYGFVGGYDGKIVEHLLQKQGVAFDFTPIKHETRTNIIVTDIITHEQTRIDAPGPRISRQELETLKQKLRQIEPDFLVMSGSVPPGVPVDIYSQLIQEAKARGLRCILDSDGEWLKEGVKARPYLIKPNVHETERLLKAELATEELLVNAARELVEMGTEVAIISRGKDGLIAATGDTVLKAIVAPVEARSTVGAGDSTVAGLVLKLAQGGSLVEACRLGAAAGTAAVLTPGTELCRRSDVDSILTQVKVEMIRRGSN